MAHYLHLEEIVDAIVVRFIGKTTTFNLHDQVLTFDTLLEFTSQFHHLKLGLAVVFDKSCLSVHFFNDLDQLFGLFNNQSISFLYLKDILELIESRITKKLDFRSRATVYIETVNFVLQAMQSFLGLC